MTALQKKPDTDKDKYKESLKASLEFGVGKTPHPYGSGKHLFHASKILVDYKCEN